MTQRKRFHRERPPRRKAGAGWLAVLLAGLMLLPAVPGGMGWAVVLFGLVALAAGFAAAALAPRLVRRRGLAVGPRGVGEVFGPFTRWHPWDSVVDVRARGDQAAILTRDGEIVVGPEVEHWSDLIRSVAATVGVAPPPCDDDAAEDLVAPGLGHGRISTPVSAPLVSFVLLACAAALVLGLLLGLFVSRAAGTLALLTVLVPPWLASRGRVPLSHRLRAGADGLRVLGITTEREYDWSDLRQLEPLGRRWRLALRDEVYVLDPEHRDAPRLLAAVERLLAARRESVALPRSGAVSEAAISRVADGRVDAERRRGLSRGDERNA